ELSQRSAALASDALDDGAGLRCRHAADDRTARLDDARLLGRDARQAVAELLRVIEADAGDDRQRRPADVGRIKTTAETNLDDGRLGATTPEVEEAQRRRNLEERQLQAGRRRQRR